MIPAFHDYSLEPKITKCEDLLYNVHFTHIYIFDRILVRFTGSKWLFFSTQFVPLVSILVPKLLEDQNYQIKKL
jgi:hypothetical protein